MFLFSLLCNCMYLCVCRYMYVFASVYGGQRSTLVVIPQELSSLLLETDPRNLIRLGWLVSKGQGSICLCASASPVLFS